jgi:hypothetical protein
LVVEHLEVVCDLLDLLGITVAWKILAQVLEEVFHSVGSSTVVENFTHALTVHLVFLLSVEFERWLLVDVSSSKELIRQSPLGLLLQEQSLLGSGHLAGVNGGLLGGDWSSSELGLSLLEDLVIVDFIRLLNATIFLGIKSCFLRLLLFLFRNLICINLVLIVELRWGLCLFRFFFLLVI